jgi:hypothetical protein
MERKEMRDAVDSVFFPRSPAQPDPFMEKLPDPSPLAALNTLRLLENDFREQVNEHEQHAILNEIPRQLWLHLEVDKSEKRQRTTQLISTLVKKGAISSKIVDPHSISKENIQKAYTESCSEVFKKSRSQTPSQEKRSSLVSSHVAFIISITYHALFTFTPAAIPYWKTSNPLHKILCDVFFRAYEYRGGSLSSIVSSLAQCPPLLLPLTLSGVYHLISGFHLETFTNRQDEVAGTIRSTASAASEMKKAFDGFVLGYKQIGILEALLPYANELTKSEKLPLPKHSKSESSSIAAPVSSSLSTVHEKRIQAISSLLDLAIQDKS